MRGGLIRGTFAVVAALVAVACSFDAGLQRPAANDQLDSVQPVDAGSADDAATFADAEASGLPACMTDSAYLPNPATGRRYRAVDVVVDWPTARAGCEQHGGHLLVVDDQAENDYAVSLLGGKLWLGLTDEVVEGQFVWVTGAPLTFANWFPGQPDNFLFGENYAEIRFAGQWNDLAAAGINNRYICECDPAWSPGS